MCSALTVAIVVFALLQISVGVLVWLAFLASVKQHRSVAGVVVDGLRDDSGLTAFEREHLRRLITNDFTELTDPALRMLVSNARRWMLVSVAIGAGTVLFLLIRISYCSS